MKFIIASIAAPLLASCAMSSNGLAQSPVEKTYTSTKAPGVVAECIAGILNGSMSSEMVSPSKYIVTRQNGYHIPMARWDVNGDGTGSKIEFRKSVGIMIGEAKAAACY